MALLNTHWSAAIARLEAQGSPYAIATVIATSGSTPRNHGSKIVISGEDTYSSIGGGQLEFLVIQRARELIVKGLDCQELKQFPLGAEAKQCCGGSVSILLECFAGSDMQVVIFGAGHVARALLGILQELDCRSTVIDSRPDLLQQNFNSQVHRICHDQPETLVPTLPAKSHVLIMTHDHALDYRLVQALLEQGRHAFVGLIGSGTKAKRFRLRLQHDGFDEEQLHALQCPVGMDGLKGKLPMEVAVSIAAALLMRQQENSAHERRHPQSWREMKALLKQAQPATAEDAS